VERFWLCLFVFPRARAICFGSNSKEIAQGYRLKRIGNPSRFALLAPYDHGGLIIDEIGWRKPFILFWASGSEYWDRVDTDHASHIRISDAQRTSNPDYRSIRIESAEIAWDNQAKQTNVVMATISPCV
jgi:hypothetical protein